MPYYSYPKMILYGFGSALSYPSFSMRQSMLEAPQFP